MKELFNQINPYGAQRKILFQVDKLNEFLGTGDTWPCQVEVNTTNQCNLDCEWCLSWNFPRDKTELDLNKYKWFLRGFEKHGGQSVVFSGGGEPTMHTQWQKMVLATKELELHIGLFTNGIYPHKYNMIIGHNIDWIRIGLDTAIPEHYKKWKGKDYLGHVLKNIESLRRYPVRVTVGANIYPEYTIEDAQSLLNHSSIIDGIQFRPDYRNPPNKEVWEFLRNLPPSTKKVRLGLDKLEEAESGVLHPFSSCEGHRLIPILDANGDLCVCMYHPEDERFVFGNINEQTFEKIWRGDRRQEVLEFVQSLDYCTACPITCRLNELNKILDYVLHPEDEEDARFL